VRSAARLTAYRPGIGTLGLDKKRKKNKQEGDGRGLRGKKGGGGGRLREGGRAEDSVVQIGTALK